MLKKLDFLGKICTLHSVPWNRDGQNAGFSRDVSAQNAGFSREMSALCIACPGCEMLKMVDFLGKSLHFAQRALESRCSKCWIF